MKEAVSFAGQPDLHVGLWGHRGRSERGAVVVAMTNPIYLTARS